MRITLVQSDLIWENRNKNLESFCSLLSGLSNKTDLVILPEMFTTGFSMDVESLAEPFPGITFNWMKETSAKGNFAVCGSYIVENKKNYFNRLLFVKPGGEYSFYDKRHLFGPGGEDKVYKKGKDRVIVKHLGFRINLQICYDLRFPVWARNRKDYDLLINVANWPESRSEAWSILLKARAIENQCFVAGVSRIGVDGKGINCSGESMIINPFGNIIASIGKNTEGHITHDLSLQEIEKIRTGFPVWKDADDFIINV